jgi:HK97 family phage major capsid protein
MIGGLAEAVAVQALTGDGVSPNLHGISTASGIQTVAFTTDALTTLRKAITACESLSLNPFLVVMAPSTWESIELLRSNGATGDYLLRNGDNALPIDRSKRQVWGVPVALSTSVPSGAGAKAYVLSQDSVKLFTDGVIDFRFGYAASGFEKNQVTARAEGRFQMGVLRPAGVVQATVAA